MAREPDLKFAKTVFTLAGAWGILITLPLYFLRNFVDRQSPPAITHPEFYYGFVGVTLTWQLIFLIIGRDPARYRSLMLPSILEKLSYVLANLGLVICHETSTSQAFLSSPDLVLAILFSFALLRTKSKHLERETWECS